MSIFKLCARAAFAAALLLIPATTLAASTAEALATGTENLLFLPQAQRRIAFARISELAPTRTIRASDQVLPLPPGDAPLPDVSYMVDGESHALASFLENDSLMGMIVVQGGEVLLEHYAPDHGPDVRWVSFSVSKSVTSMLIGAAIQDGYIPNVDVPVAAYLPRLRGTPYASATIRHVLNMASGVAWNEDYADPSSDVSRAGASNGIELVAYLADLPAAHAPGEVFNYSTGETNLVGEILRAAIGNNASTYLEHRIWQPFGMESDATWLLGAPGGGETGGCCISATLRDYARLGLFAMSAGGLANGLRVLPEDWMAASTTPSPAAPFYGYLWWLEAGDAFGAQGIFGQRIHIDPARELVIAMHSNAPAAVGTDYHRHQVAVLEAIGRALD